MNRLASNPGVHTTLPPAPSVGNRLRRMPDAAKFGVSSSARSACVSWILAARATADATRFRLSYGTDLGRAVVPDVCSSIETSDGRGRFGATGSRPVFSESSNVPAPSVGANTTRPTGTPSAIATSRAGESSTSATTSASMRICSIRCRHDAVSSAGFNGAQAAQSLTAIRSVAISGPFGIASAMRLPRPRPAPASACTMRSTWRSRPSNESGGRSGASSASAAGSRTARAAIRSSSDVGVVSTPGSAIAFTAPRPVHAPDRQKGSPRFPACVGSTPIR